MSTKLKISRNKLILVEGADAYWFLIWALKAYSIEDVQVMDFGGNPDLFLFIKTLKNLDNFDLVTSIIIARDAETDHTAAFSSVTAALKNNGLSVPDILFSYKDGNPKIAVMLFPGYDQNGNIENGCLEHLCLKTINDKTIETTEKYLKDVNESHEKLTHEHKSKLHAYLSVKNKFVGSKLGEAANYGAWDWLAPSLIPFKETIENS